MSTYIYLFVKYAIEAAMFDFVVAYACQRKLRSSLKCVVCAWWLILLTAAVEVGLHSLLPSFTFPLRYAAFNYLSTALFWRITIHKRTNLARVVGTYSLLCILILQTLATYVIYVLPSLAAHVQHFGLKEDILSFMAIFSMSVLVLCYILRCVRDIYDFERREAIMINVFGWVLFGTIEIMTIYLVEPNRYYLIAVLIMMLLLAEMMLYLAMSAAMVRERIRNVEQQRINQQYALLSEHVEEVQHLYRSMRETRHEMKNHFHYIRALLDDQRYDGLSSYIGEQEIQLLPAFQAFDCGNSLVNAILWSKREQAEQAGIAFHVQAALPPKLPIKGHHLCSVLVNLLNNAIEASMDTPDPGIDLTLQIKQGYLYFCVTNSVRSNVLAENPELRTTKRDVLDHGYGIKNIRAIAEQYCGMSEFALENGRFIATVMLLLPQAEKKEP